jgi:outer membrane murein-binding lipoprotein Lpp
MGFLDKAKSAAEQAANRAKETAEDVQTKRELAQTYSELGRVAFELIEGGEVSHARLTPLADKIRELAAKAGEEETKEEEEEEPASTPA